MRWLAQVRLRFSLRGPYPKVFLGWSVRGHRFGRVVFALVCAVPLLVAWVVLPVFAVSLLRAWGPSIASTLGIAMGISLYWLRYSVLALRRRRGTLVEVLEEVGGLRFYEPVPHAAGRDAR